MSIELGPLVAVIAEAEAKRDPLAAFRFQCDGARRFARYVASGLDTHAHTGNKGTKTTTGAAIMVAMLQGRDSLDGVALPKLPQPATGWLLVKTRKGQVESSQKQYRRMIGDWPHTEAFSNRGLDYVELWRIKPRGASSDDPANWSTLRVHCEESAESLPGGLVDVIHADEPPDRENWREARFRSESNRKLYRFITETPIFRSEWWWLFHEDDGYRNCLDEPRGGRVSVNWDVREVKCHSGAYLRELEEAGVGDPVLQARLSGWPVDDEGSAPFDGKALAAWRSRCVEPERIEVSLLLSAEDGADAEILAPKAVYQRWCAPEQWGRYALIGDPSVGIDDGKHDPSGLHGYEEIDPALVTRFSGYLDGYSFGYLTGVVGRDYGNAEAFIETQGGAGYGGEAIRALRRMRYPRIGHDVKTNDPTGKPRIQYGFATTPGTRPAYVAAIQAALAYELAGKPVIKVWSREVVDCLADIIVNKKTGKIEAPPGRHDEDMILLGYALKRLGMPHARAAERRVVADPLAEVLRREFGHAIKLPPASWTAGSKRRREVGQFR